ncbi:MAG TPA: response regulator [Burkholderiales bacterium]
MTRLLVADDDRQIRAILKLSLEAAGYEVETVADGAGAVRAHEERPADLLITDLFMPERDGLETVEYFRARHPSMPIIAISGWKPGQRADYLEVARVAGADAVLRKPFTIDELLAQVQDVASARISMQQVPRAG